ncbi:MAG: M48 family metallopeptidase [Defluviitaleaceae bacterium]|nr:M48 family metallopeptidase [Defluviitaleaceae bacterium]
MAKIEKLFIQPFEIDVHYKKMKNIYLKVKPDGKMMISAPIGTSKKYLTQFVQERLEWIHEKQEKVAMRQASAMELKKDETLLFGQPFSGVLSDVERQLLLHEKIMAYYKKYWPFFSSQGCQPVDMKYRMMKLTWGVCRPTVGTITFNKRLVHQPVEFIEYVVLHEMCHLLVPNHSRDFYALVASHMPHFKAYENARIVYEG